MPKSLKKLIIFICLMMAIFIVGNFVLAQSADTLLFGGTENQIGNTIGLGEEDPRIIIANVIRVALGFLGIIALGLVIYSGWLWMTAGGNADNIEKAKKILVGALIGLLIILSSFLITTFILNRLLIATGGGGGTPCVSGTTQNCGCGGNQICTAGFWGTCVGSSCVTPNTLFVQSIQPANLATPITVPMNTVIRYSFNQNVDGTTVDGNTFTVDDSNGTVAGNYNTAGRLVEFKPSGTCPANACGAIECFKAGETITALAVQGNIFNLTGLVPLTCAGSSCNLAFVVGNTVDCASPTVSILPSPLPQICVDDAVAIDLGFNATDDSGVSQVVFDVGGDIFDFVTSTVVACTGLCASWLESPVNQTVQWWPTSTNYTAGQTYTLSATAYDLDSNTAVDGKSFIMRDGHCCNGVQDVANGETGIDCGGLNCAACSGAACAVDAANMPASSCDDTLCSSSFCSSFGSDAASCAAAGYGAIGSCCICQNSPIIDWVTPMGGFCKAALNTSCQTDSDCGASDTCDTSTPNGTDGNLVTIGGRYFGAFGTGSRVDFSDDDGITWTQALLADSVNLSCTNNWSDNQIIAVQPSGLAQGMGSNYRVMVTAANSFTDDTQSADGVGPDLDYAVNTIQRPGLCLLNPNNGVKGDILTYEGIWLDSGTTGYFGNISSNVIALNSNFPTISNTQGQASAPNLITGKTSTFVLNSGISSNYLDFIKNAEASVGPQITSFSPAQGAPGQYVTIYGSGFGNTQGGSNVNFGIAGTQANYNFPAVCADSVWNDNQIIVKVPTMGNSVAPIEIDISGWPTIDTGATTFNVDNSLSLTPSLCKINPIMGPNNTLISLFGEYFDDGSGGSNTATRFQLNQPQGPPLAILTSGGADEINTTVPQNAISGAVQVELSGTPGNSINFQVGSCTASTDCGGTTCCPVGTYKAGMCATDTSAPLGVIDINDCYAGASSSVYEWDFSTSVSIPPSTCSGYSLSQCSLGSFCPNSPGQCSSYAGGAITITGGCADSDCGSVGACTASCTYDVSLNKCVDLTQPTSNPGNCSLDSSDFDVFGNTITIYCDEYDNGSTVYTVWHMDTSTSCPTGWTRISGNRCVDSTTAATCDFCNSGFACFDDNSGGGAGKCLVNQDICSAGSVCNPNTNKCESADNAKCECCCNIDDNAGYPALGGINPSCCAPLTCSNSCGNDTTNDNAGFGVCTGCDALGATPAEKDAACNCAGTTGKVCDTTVPGGACVDATPQGGNCNASVLPVCQDDGTCVSGTFCDPLAANPCTCQQIIVNTPCDFSGTMPSCGINGIDMCASVGLFCDPLAAKPCSCQLSGLPTGASCEDPVSPPACLAASPCTLGLSCLSDSPLFPSSGNCGNCCCDINNDQCSSINPVLICNYDTGSGGSCDDTNPGTAPDFGLCCGCSLDSQCGNTVAVGCARDTCCKPRPTVIDTGTSGSKDPQPYNGSMNVCRNSKITATFDQKMDKSSFTGNIVVVGDYKTGQCPAGTTYLTAKENKSLIARIFIKPLNFIKKIFPFISRNVTALTGNFCAISGTVSGADNTAGTETTLSFSPNNILDANTTYYVIIKGDSDTSDEVDEGVLSYDSISMDGIDTGTFNAIDYSGKIWSFTTMDKQATSGEVCKISYIDVSPSSYLFQTTSDDINEDDSNPNSNSFNTAKDSDTVFTAEAIASNGQVLSEITGVYEWTWSWISDNPLVVDLDGASPFILDYNKQLYEAQAGVTDSSATITVTADVSGSAEDLSAGGEIYSDQAQAWVFICENPWPPVVSGTWKPWSDSGTSCMSGAACPSVNYEFYYCRDSGGTGTQDDLPAINSSNTIIIGSSTVTNLLKEFYFFREALPLITSGSITVIDLSDNDNGEVVVSWNPVAGATDYKVYYGMNSGNYSSYVDIKNALTTNISGLSIGATYYFAVTSYDSGTGAESGYSSEASIVLADIIPPITPAGVTVTPGNSEVTISWTANTSDTAKYRIYYGTASGSYGGSQDIDSGYTSAIITGLANGVTYYLNITAVDSYDNESLPLGVDLSAMPL